MSEYVFPFEKLDVWQLAIELAEHILNLLEGLGKAEASSSNLEPLL